ncbi:MAG: hypothetical protein U0637_05540 [Phycisphaerales bacterium]
MQPTVPSHLTKFHWEPQPAAQKVVDGLVNDFLGKSEWASALAKRMKGETGTRFKDWVDHIAVPHTDALAKALREAGFQHRPTHHAPGNYECDAGIFPSIILSKNSHLHLVAIKVDSVVDFLAAHDLSHHDSINDGGEKGVGSRLRMALAASCGTAAHRYELWVIERHGMAGFDYDNSTPEQRLRAAEHAERLRTRRREFPKDADGFAEVHRIVDAAVKDLGRDWTCDLFFESERRYWMKRNRAAQVQYARQNRLGLGWANHDHHTYRSSREHFADMVGLWEKLGFQCREVFYAGSEAGWGAQVMEQPVTKITTFNDVDMSPEELVQDFAHNGFVVRHDSLGTVGMWVALHGEAVLQAGMHHLECQFDYQALVEQLEKSGGVKHMAPFTTFPYLRQAFTEGERWAVNPRRVEKLVSDGHITRRQGDAFLKEGAVGSHLETLERNDGFKGFNQRGVSDIIQRTDPRRLVSLGGA